MAEQSSADKTEQATPRRKQEARKKGTVARSTDLVGALTLLAAVLIGPSAVSALAQSLLGGFVSTAKGTPRGLRPSEIVQFSGGSFAGAYSAVAPIFLAMLTVGLVANFAQVGFVLSGESLKPDMNRLNPLPGVKRLFSAKTFFEGFKTTAKMLAFSFVAFSTIRDNWEVINGLSRYTIPEAAGIVGGITHTILLRVSVAWLVLAAADYIFQRRQVEKQLMMTKDELRREMKEQEGSPEIKAAQYRRRRQLAKGSLASQLKSADVVVTNPTHFAVAIAYERSKMHAPMVVAKGQDLVAQRMKEIAKDNKVPVVENKTLARALYKKCEAGDFVPRELFGPVAEVLAYVYETLSRVKR